MSSGKVIVIFNGPPNSGKDFAAKALSQKFGVPHFEMKAALRKTAHMLVADHLYIMDAGIKTREYALTMAPRTCNRYEYDPALKDTELFDAFGGRTWRQFLIHISENIMKPIYGADVFGRAAAKLVREMNADLCFFSDGGFQAEVEELRKEGTVIVIQLERFGCSFEGDSRGYINGDHTTVIVNKGDGSFVAAAELRVLDIIASFDPALEEMYAVKT